MLFASTPDQLDHGDIDRGRLAADEGNPFTLLEKQKRRHKKSSKLFGRAREQLQETRHLHDIMSVQDRNPYGPLYLPSTSFLDLSGEFRKLVYGYALSNYQESFSGPEASLNSYFSSAAHYKGRCSWNRYVFRQPHRNLLRINKQISGEWRSILDHHVPVQMYTVMSLKKTDEMSQLHLGTFENAFPIVEVTCVPETHDLDQCGQSQLTCTTKSRGIFLDLTCRVIGLRPEPGEFHKMDLRTSEEELNFDVITSERFEEIGNRLRQCDRLEDLIIEWRLTADWDYDHHPLASSGTSNMLFESMIQVIETLPKLHRYCIKCGDYAMFASRSEGRSWDDDTTLRLSHETEEGYFSGPCEALYHDLGK